MTEPRRPNYGTRAERLVGTDIGIRPFGYLTSMVMTIGLWLALAPAAGAIARVSPQSKKS